LTELQFKAFVKCFIGNLGSISCSFLKSRWYNDLTHFNSIL